MTKLTLNYQTWRCGDDSEEPSNKLGTGETMLLNKDGYMCCLGQWSLQLGCSKEEIIGRGDTFDLEEADFGEADFMMNDKFVQSAIRINDDCDTTADEKAMLLQNLCDDIGVKLEVINSPATP